MQDQHTRTAGMPYVALFLHKIMEGLGGGHRKWSQSAAAFLGLLKAGHLPAVTVSAPAYPLCQAVLLISNPASVSVSHTINPIGSVVCLEKKARRVVIILLTTTIHAILTELVMSSRWMLKLGYNT